MYIYIYYNIYIYIYIYIYMPSLKESVAASFVAIHRSRWRKHYPLTCVVTLVVILCLVISYISVICCVSEGAFVAIYECFAFVAVYYYCLRPAWVVLDLVGLLENEEENFFSLGVCLTSFWYALLAADIHCASLMQRRSVSAPLMLFS